MKEPSASMLEAVREAALAHGLDPVMVAGMVATESAWDPWAIRHEPVYRWLWPTAYKVKVPQGVSKATEINQQKTSWGLLQVMGAVARERGYLLPFLTGLCVPQVGLEYGCRHLEHLRGRGWDGDELISAYNAGHPTDANLGYVQKVRAAMARLQGRLG